MLGFNDQSDFKPWPSPKINTFIRFAWDKWILTLVCSSVFTRLSSGCKITSCRVFHPNRCCIKGVYCWSLLTKRYKCFFSLIWPSIRGNVRVLKRSDDSTVDTSSPLIYFITVIIIIIISVNVSYYISK